jgi:diaminohydroxyphosphoribosylaminopyrimidine deaminase/5-amino-6-(5-phosphoribosylamino)uracil reductase
MVGALIVKNGRVLSRGFHKKAGGDHAELMAIKKAGAQARGAELILNLEPCCHTGKTPPCTSAIIEAGIKRVVVGMKDPNTLVGGKGIAKLRRNGIQVVTGVLRQECEKLNEIFCKFITTATPFVILKSAVSLDGKIATRTGDSKWITGPKARQRVHQIRHQVDAILVGPGTVLADNPRLTTRLQGGGGKHPIRVILDGKEALPLSAKVFQNSRSQKVIYVCGKTLSSNRRKALEKKNVEILAVKEKNGRLNLKDLIIILGARKVTSVLVEGGAGVNASILQAGLVDKVILFVAPILIGGRDAPGLIGGEGIRRLQNAFRMQNLQVSQLGNDIMIEGRATADNVRRKY